MTTRMIQEKGGILTLEPYIRKHLIPSLKEKTFKNPINVLSLSFANTKTSTFILVLNTLQK